MADKEAYYFSHDANARHDPDILEMVSVYGMIGYGWYWVLVEMMREQEDYRLKLCKRNAIAMQMHCDTETADKFVQECIKQFDLFSSDGEYFWSESLIRRMAKKDEKSEKARLSAKKRWDNANAMQTQCDGNALKESKVKEIKEIKEKESKSISPLPKIIEKEFGRPLSPLEVQQILIWAEYDTDIVLHAVKTAVVNGKFNLKYIDTILLNWEKKNLRTVKDIQAHEKAYIEKKNKPNKPIIQSNDNTDLNILYNNQTNTDLYEDEDNPFKSEVM